MKVKSKITSFSYGKNLKNNQFSQFTSMKNSKLQISEGEVEVFLTHLEQLKCDIDKRSTGVFQFNLPKWNMDTFVADLFEVNVDLQETFSDLQTYLELKVNFTKE